MGFECFTIRLCWKQPRILPGKHSSAPQATASEDATNATRPCHQQTLRCCTSDNRHSIYGDVSEGLNEATGFENRSLGFLTRWLSVFIYISKFLCVVFRVISVLCLWDLSLGMQSHCRMAVGGCTPRHDLPAFNSFERSS